MTVYAITDTKKGEQGLRLLIFKLPFFLGDMILSRPIPYEDDIGVRTSSQL